MKDALPENEVTDVEPKHRSQQDCFQILGEVL